MPHDLTDAEVAWLAGLLEGEGCFWVMNKGGRTPGATPRRYPRITMVMTDRDTVTTAAAMFGRACGVAPRKVTVRNPPSKAGNRKEQYGVYLIGASAMSVMRTVRPWMHSRRTAKIDEILTEFASLVSNGRRADLHGPPST